MVTVVILGETSGQTLFQAVGQTLSSQFPVASIQGEENLSGCSMPEFLLCAAPKGVLKTGENSIFVCPEGSFFLPEIVMPAAGSVGVLSGDNKQAADFLTRTGIPAVTCGMHLQDTLTLSSHQGDSAVVCLQRRLPTLFGSMEEPGEFTLRLKKPWKAYPLLCISAICLLAGKGDKLSDLLFC